MHLAGRYTQTDTMYQTKNVNLQHTLMKFVNLSFFRKRVDLNIQDSAKEMLTGKHRDELTEVFC